MLRDLTIKRLPIPEKRIELADGRIAGLYLAVQPTGAKSWVFRYRPKGGLPAKLTIGRYPAISIVQARRLAQQAAVAHAEGKGPAPREDRRQGGR
jgi:hypothetical protein